MIALSDKWAPVLLSKPETGMGYQIVTITTIDGRSFEKIIVAGGIISKVPGYNGIPFKEEEIVGILVTHDKT